MRWIGIIIILGLSGRWRCMCQFWSQNSVKFRLSEAVDRNIEKVSLVLLFCFKVLSYSYSIPGYVTLSLVVNPRHDKKTN